VEKAISAFGRLTGVCLNAGVFGPCHRISEAVVDKWDTAFHINVLSHLLTVGLSWYLDVPEFLVIYS
jgi:NAD(P)-dependent dehydrogenase (short-subunit alcohol dehydrogenase family)